MAHRKSNATFLLTQSGKNVHKPLIMDERTNSAYELRLRAVEAVRRGRSMSDIADAFGTNRSTVSRWVKRFENEGERGLQRRPTSGRPRKLEDLTVEGLVNIILQPASQFGYETDLWTVGRLRVVIEEQHRVYVSKDTIWRRLREAGLTYQKPEREYYEFDEESREEWLRKDVPKIRETVA